MTEPQHLTRILSKDSRNMSSQITEFFHEKDVTFELQNKKLEFLAPEIFTHNVEDNSNYEIKFKVIQTHRKFNFKSAFNQFDRFCIPNSVEMHKSSKFQNKS